MKGAQGETGLKGERGDPGLPVRTQHINRINVMSNYKYN